MKYNILFFIAFVSVFLPLFTHAGEFMPLVGVPGLSGDPSAGGLSSYINALYRLSISIAALLAVIKIVIAGAKYMLSDIITHKEDAKKDIQGALIGLLIVIGAIVILNTINTDLTDIDINMASTTVRQGTSIQDIIARQQQQLADIASSTNSVEMVLTCRTSIVGSLNFTTLEGESWGEACERVCETIYRGQYSDNWTADTCRFVESRAFSCDASQSWDCCEQINGASWSDGPPSSCSGLTEARDERRLECGQEERVWDEAGNYCRTASCNLNTDANCCAAAGRTIQNGVCSTTSNDVTDEQECIDRGAGWVYINGTCRAQTPGNVTQPLPTPRPTDPYTYCFRIAPQGTWEFNESADLCQIIPTN